MKTNSTSLIVDEFTIRQYQVGDEKYINRKFNHIFSQKRKLAEWHWKFNSLNKSNILLAFNLQNELVSQYALITNEFSYKGQEFICGQSVDSFSDNMPGAVRLRLFEKLVGHVYEIFGHSGDVHLMYGFPGTRKLKLGRLRLDYGKAIPVKYWEKTINRARKKLWSIRKPTRLDRHAIDDLWQRAKHRYPISIVRNAHWFNKRYLSHPKHSYKFIKNSETEAYNCLGVYTTRSKNIELVDLIWDGQNIDDLQDLESTLVEKAVKNGSNKISMWFSGDSEAEDFFSENSWDCKIDPLNLHMVVKSFNQDICHQDLLNNFYLTKGCSDII